MNSWTVACAGALWLTAANAALAQTTTINGLPSGGNCQPGDEVPMWRPGAPPNTLKTTCGGIASLAAPLGAEYLVNTLNGSLTAERNLTAGDGIAATDGGANAALDLDLEFSELPDNTVPAFDSTLAIDTGSAIQESTLEQIGGYLANDHHRRRVELYDDLTVAVANGGAGQWIEQTFAGAGTASTPTCLGTECAAHPGIIQFESGTTATGRAGVISESSFLFGAGEHYFEAVIRIEDPATVGEDFDIRVGFCDSATGDCVDGVYFEYDQNNNTNWNVVTANNSTRTRNDSNVVVVADAWIKLGVRVNAAGTNAEFFVDDVETANSDITTNIPTATGRETSMFGGIVKSAGTTERVWYIDYVFGSIDLTTAR